MTLNENEESGAHVPSDYRVHCRNGNLNLHSPSMGVGAMSDNNNELEESDRQAAETNRIGAEGNRISAETDRIAAESARSETAYKLAGSRRRKDVGQVFAYLLIVIVATFGFYQSNQVDERVCTVAAENRGSLRSLVIALDALGKSLITGGKPESELDASQVASLKQFEAFTKAQLELLEYPVC